MSRRVSIGYQEFADIISNDLFYVDKTLFIKEWWERRDYVTLITRPRRFGKTLTMSMIENLDEYDTPVQEARKYGFAFCGKQVLIGK